jgi:hypothetical protein
MAKSKGSGSPGGLLKTGLIYIDEKLGRITVLAEGDPPVEIMWVGFCGNDSAGVPMYGMMIIDADGIGTFFAGQHVGGF